MKNKILGLVGIVWGGAIVAQHFLGEPLPGMDSAYLAGRNAAVYFGAALLLVGLFTFFKKPKKARARR